jgi:hypothetical protein
MGLAVDFLLLHTEDPLATKEAEFRKAVIMFLCCLETIVYVFPVVGFGIVLLKARLPSQAVVSSCVVTELATTPIWFQGRTKFYLPLLLAQFHHIVDDLNANRAS